MRNFFRLLAAPKWSSYFVISLLIVLKSLESPAQNLVPNYSFDTVTSCPGYANSCNISLAVPWKNAINGFGESQVAHACAPEQYCSVPNGSASNIPYFQYPHTGPGYGGARCYDSGIQNNRQYLCVPLKNLLINNMTYYVEFYTNLANYCPYATNNVSVLFTNFRPLATGVLGLIDQTPSIIGYGNPIISDTLNWIKIGGIFHANGGESWLSLGNFSDDAHTDTISAPGGYQYYPTAYLFDDISVIPLDSFLLPADAGPDRTITEGDSTFIGTYINGLTCTWYNAAGQVINTVAPGFKVAPTTSTWYALKQEVAGQTAYDTVNVFVIPLAVKEEELLAEIQVYPNPSTGNVTVKIPASLGSNWQVGVSSVDGRSVPLSITSNRSGYIQFSMAAVTGIYFVKVRNLETQQEIIRKLTLNQ